MRIQEIIQKLLITPKDNFPGAESHMQMTPYKKDLIIPNKDPKLSAVMILIYEKAEESEIVLLKRADYQGVHSSQVSFPGGKMDELDADLKQTAIRELYEETGIRLEDANIIKQLSEMYIPPSNFMVHPFVAITEKLPEIKLDERESQYHFGIRINELLSDDFLDVTDISTSYGKMKNVPYFRLNNEIIWGATAAILNELKWILKK